MFNPTAGLDESATLTPALLTSFQDDSSVKLLGEHLHLMFSCAAETLRRSTKLLKDSFVDTQMMKKLHGKDTPEVIWRRSINPSIYYLNHVSSFGCVGHLNQMEYPIKFKGCIVCFFKRCLHKAIKRPLGGSLFWSILIPPFPASLLSSGVVQLHGRQPAVSGHVLASAAAPQHGPASAWPFAGLAGGPGQFQPVAAGDEPA